MSIHNLSALSLAALPRKKLSLRYGKPTVEQTYRVVTSAIHDLQDGDVPVGGRLLGSYVEQSQSDEAHRRDDGEWSDVGYYYSQQSWQGSVY